MFMSLVRSVYFSPTSGSGPRDMSDTVLLPRPVKQLVAGLSGYTVFFPRAEDGRPLGQLIVELLDTSFTGTQARANVRFGLRDWSGDWNDTYSGIVDYALYLELEDDDTADHSLTISALEFNQAIQFFRSELDLDAPQPDNAVPLVEGKATAVRVYADYNPTDGIKDEDVYEGELEVTPLNGAAIVLTELFGALTPRRDTTDMPLKQSQVPHFVIPAEASQAFTTIRGRLRVRRPPGALATGWSPFFETTLGFGVTDPISVFVVAFNYLGDPGNILEDHPARAATRDEAEAFFDLTRHMYPTPDVNITGFQVVDVAGPTDETFEDVLMSVLRDIKGSTDDIVHGVFSQDFEGVIPGADSEAAGGGAIRDEGIAWSVADGRSVAHELGHLFGREHAPGRENTPDVDPAFPHYGSYPWGSIGQHGVDTSAEFNEIKVPAGTFDFMSYQTTLWVSPYTYSALLAGLTPIEQIHPPGSTHAPRETLFFSATIDRDRSVVRHPSFHYPASGRLPPVKGFRFTVELADRCRRPLVCWPLTGGLGPEYCWPKTVFVP